MKLRNLRKSDRQWSIVVLSGPNVTSDLNSVGNFDELLEGWARELGIRIEHFQSNHEGKLLEFIHRSVATTNAFIVNPGGLTRVGESFRHALKDAKRPVVEVHFENDQLAPGSIFSPSVTCIFSGLRQSSYLGALVALVLALDDPDFLHPDGDAPPTLRMERRDHCTSSENLSPERGQRSIEPINAGRHQCESLHPGSYQRPGS